MRLILTILIFLPFLSFSQIATNFSVKNCAGENKKLFDLLDSGQVVILTWVTPDENGINYIESAYEVVKEFDSTYPKRVTMLICDDYGDTDCLNMSNWLAGRTFSNCVSFSDSTIRMKDYVLGGVPTFAVIGNSTHYIFNVQAGTLNDSVFRKAINAALIGPVTEEGSSSSSFNTTLSPNPCNTSLTIKYKADPNENLTLELLDNNGKWVKSLSTNKSMNGINLLTLDTTTLSPGHFFFRISGDKKSDVVKFMVMH